jgi:SOS regulatory protein LexA
MIRARHECEFTLVRYVPDPVKNEFVNIGVVLRDAGSTLVRFTRDWSRVRRVDPLADTAMLESLEEELRARMQGGTKAGAGAAVERPLWEVLEESLSNSVQLSERKAYLAETAAGEIGHLMQMYVESAPQSKAGRHAARGRAALVETMRRQFEQAGVWEKMRKRIPAAEYTRSGDPLKIDCGYRPNGVVRMFQAVTLEADNDAAKVLAYTLPALAEGVRRIENAGLELTAVIEPLRQLRPETDTEASGEIEQRYRFGVDVMEQAGLRVLTSADMERVAETARAELESYVEDPEQKLPDRSRPIAVMPDRSKIASQGLPLMGRIAAGSPVESVARTESLSLSDITGNREVFTLQVKGDSMRDEHIIDGDFVLIEPTETAEQGEIVLARVEGAEASLHRYYREGERVRLQPSNGEMAAIWAPAEKVTIEGRVAGVLRRY